jgi:hypothetical protein
MAEHFNDGNAADKKHEHPEKESESLFNQSHDHPEKQSDKNNSVTGSGKNESGAGNSAIHSETNDRAAGKEHTEGGESLYTSLMNDMKELKAYGGKIAESTGKAYDSAFDKAASYLKKSGSEENSMLGSFEVVHSPADATQAAHKIEMQHAADAKTFAANHMLESMGKDAYHAEHAAYMTVANKLADDPRLLKMVTDATGHVTEASVDRVLKADAAAGLMADKHGINIPRELTDSERESLITVRTHISKAAEIGMIVGGVNPHAAIASAGLVARALEGMSTKDITDKLATFKDNTQKSGSTEEKNVIQDKTSNFEKFANDNKIVDADKVANALGLGISYQALFERLRHGDDSGKSGAATEGFKPRVAGGDSQPSAQPQKAPEAPPAPSDKSPEKSAEKPAAPRVDVPQLTDAEFPEVAKQVLAKLDTNHTGEITKEQLAKALEDPSFKGKEAQALAAMYQGFDRMHDLSKHEGWLLPKHCLTAADLDKYGEVQKEEGQRSQEAYEMKNWAHNNMSKFDKNGGGSLNKWEIEAALKDKNTSAEDRKMLETIKKHFSEMGHFWESGINLKAFDNYAANIYKDTDHAKLVAEVWGACYNVNKGQKPDISHDLYSDAANPLNSIKPDAIRQGSIGDCYFESSLAALANSNPGVIKNAIKDNGDGTYTVTFPGDKDHPIKVKAPTEAEQGLYNHGSPNGYWASVMEKAFGQYRQNDHWWNRLTNLGGGNTPEEGADGGGFTTPTMKLLTGHDVDGDILAFHSQSAIAAKLEKAFSSNPPKGVCASTLGELPFTGENTADGFCKGHAYTITNFVPDGKGGGMITIRNPWGGPADSTSGTITIPLDKFMKNFAGMSFEQ